MDNYAPEYTRKEKIILLVKILVPATMLFLLAEYWFFDWLTEYAKKSNCYNYGNVNGVHVIFYGAFVGIPLSMAVVLFIIEGRRSIKVIKVGQNPLPNEKVLKPTKYKYGWKAKMQPYAFLSILVVLVFTSIWGGFQAHELTREIKPCDVNISYITNYQLTVSSTRTGNSIFCQLAWSLN